MTASLIILLAGGTAIMSSQILPKGALKMTDKLKELFSSKSSVSNSVIVPIPATQKTKQDSSIRHIIKLFGKQFSHSITAILQQNILNEIKQNEDQFHHQLAKTLETAVTTLKEHNQQLNINLAKVHIPEQIVGETLKDSLE